MENIKKMLAPLFVAIMAISKFAPFIFKTGGTMLLSIALYAQIWGWQYAVGFVLLIFIHELGHLVAARLMGLNVGLPVFIPFMGAVIALKEAPKNAWIEAVVGIGGPILGTLGALLSMGIYYLTENPLYLALAYSGFFLNLFNLVPIVPLDGGRIVAAISPWLWLLGLVVILPFLFSTWNILLIILVVLSLKRVIDLFRKKTEEEIRYYECSKQQRIVISGLYFLLLAGLVFLMEKSHFTP